MEKGFLSPKGRGSKKGVKEKGNDQVHAKMTSIPNVENSKPGIQVDANTLGANFGNATQADQNTQRDHNLGGLTASVSTGQGTKGSSTTNNKGHVSFAKLVTGEPNFSKDGLSAIATKHGTPLMLDSYKSAMSTESWGRSSFARAVIDLRADVELKDTIMVDVLKLVGKGFSRCNIRNLKNPRQVVRGIQVGPKNDDDLGTNGGNYKLDNKGSKSLSSPTNTPPVIRINNLESQIQDGKLALVDDDGKPLKKVDSPVNSDSESEVEERETNMDDEYDPYDDDLYDGHDMSENLQAICDDWGIKSIVLSKSIHALSFAVTFYFSSESS
ncbi:hypothetical protein Tco_1314563 [Tanacetum coccineum]